MRLFKSHLFKSSIFAGILAVAFASCGRPSTYFTFEVSPTVISLAPGESANIKALLSAEPGFNGTARVRTSSPYLSFPGAADFSKDVDLGSGQSQEVSIPITLKSDIPANLLQFPITIASYALPNGFEHDRTVTIVIKDKPTSGYNLELPGKIVIEQGKSASLPIKINRFGGFDHPLQISVFEINDDFGSNAISKFVVNPVETTGDSAILPITVKQPQGSETYRGAYSVELMVKDLSNGAITNSFFFDVQVIDPQNNPQPAQDFTISANPASKNANPGSSVQFDFAINKLNGFNSTVNLVAKNLPGGITVATQTENSMTFNISNNVAQGAYPIVVEASGGGLTRSANITINVGQQPSFTLSANPNNVMATTSSITPVNVQAARTNYSDVINLTIQCPVAGISLNSQNGVNQIQANSNSTMFNLVISDSAPAGNYKIMIQGASLDGKLIASTELMVSVTAKPDFSISTTNRSVDSGDNGQVISLPIQVTRTNFDKPITVFLSNVSFGGATSTAITSNSATINANTGMLDLQIKPKIATGDYVITIKGTGQGVDDRLATAMISVRDFNLKLNNKNPDTIINATVFYGKSLTLPMVATRIFGHTTPITAICNVTGLPSGVTVSANPQSIMATNSSNITFSVDPESEIPEGTYPITLRACTNVKAIEFKVNLTITYPDDF